MRQHPRGSIRRRAAVIGALLAAALAPPVVAQETDPSAISLEKLLKIPSSIPIQSGTVRRGGSTRPEWQERFEKARDDRDRAKVALEEIRSELGELSTGEAWKMSAPGLGGGGQKGSSEGSLDYKLSRELRRQREEVERSARRVKELEIEANLAGVPEDWRRSDEAAAQPEGS